MAKLDKFLSGTNGYFAPNEEDEFPFSATSGIWYSLLVIEDGKIEKYGFTAAKGQKKTFAKLLKH